MQITGPLELMLYFHMFRTKEVSRLLVRNLFLLFCTKAEKQKSISVIISPVLLWCLPSEVTKSRGKMA